MHAQQMVEYPKLTGLEMPYLIDGHNLIGQMPDLNLDAIDDEIDLANRLEDYFKHIRRKAIIFFDRGHPGGSARLKRAFVQARFVRQPGTADHAIVSYLKKQGGAARNYTVVSSDHAVRDAARRLGVRLLTSREFIKIISSNRETEKMDETIPQDELQYWLKKFRGPS